MLREKDHILSIQGENAEKKDIQGSNELLPGQER